MEPWLKFSIVMTSHLVPFWHTITCLQVIWLWTHPIWG